MGTLRPLELDPFDLLWRDLFDTQSRFSAITQKVTHPVDIYETSSGIKFEVAAVGLDSKDIDIQIDNDQLILSTKSHNQTLKIISFTKVLSVLVLI
jgi:HSP20 family molecular chaperone IbpA